MNKNNKMLTTIIVSMITFIAIGILLQRSVKADNGISEFHQGCTSLLIGNTLIIEYTTNEGGTVIVLTVL